MKTRKIISFLLMFTLLITMNVAPGFAEDMSTTEKTRLTLNYNSEGGSVVEEGEFTKNYIVCEKGEHDHEKGECDLSVLSCEKLHTHGEGCYAVCTIDEHSHDPSCYENRRTCGKEYHDCNIIKCTRITCGKEIHTHVDCKIGLVCTKEEHGILGLVHDDECYTFTCTKKISLSHLFHTRENCYTLTCGKELHAHIRVLGFCDGFLCNKEFHVHLPECHTFGNCGQEHKHTGDCYSDVLICDREHQHSDECQPLVCETPVHTDEDHSVENGCYICSIQAHTHNDEEGCFDWPDASVTATPNTGWFIESVEIDGDPQTITDTGSYYTTLYMNRDHTVDVVFAKLQFSVKADADDLVKGSATVSDETVDYGGSTTLTATANRGYRFVRWNDDNTDNPRTISNITSDQEYTAIFEALQEYTITTAVEGNGSGYVEVEVNGTVSSGPYYEGDDVTITAYADPGSYFMGWKEDDETYSTIYIPSLSSSIILTAIFEKDTGLDIRFDQSASTPGSTNVWTITNPTGLNVMFEYWLNDDTENIEEDTLGPGETKTITTAVKTNGDILNVWYCAEYEKFWGEGSARATMYTWITANTTNGSIVDDQGNTLSQDPTYYFAGSTVKLTAVPASGYRFVNNSWSVDPNDGNDVKVTTSGNTADITISDYTPPMPPTGPVLYALAADSDNDMPIWIEGINVGVGFEAIPTPPSVTYYTLNVTVEGPGKVNPTSGIYAAGSRVALTHQADEGAQFIGWFGINGSEVNSDNEILMNSNKSLIARFELIPVEEPEIVEEFIDEDTPESGDITEEEEKEEVVPDQGVPYDGPTLPQTGGIPVELVVGAGFAFITAGISLRKKDKEEKE